MNAVSKQLSCFKIWPWPQNLAPDLTERSNASIRKDKETIISLQWLVAIGLSYLIFAVEVWNSTNPLPGLLIATCLLSAIILQRMPDNIFAQGLIEPGLIIFDSVLVILAFILKSQMPWDLLLLFFFCIFIAMIGDNLLQVAIGSTLLSCVFLLFFSPNGNEAPMISADSLIRVPFMFGISLFYGFMSARLKLQKKRMEQVEAAVRARRQFVCALAHDIKTPLNVIGGYAELLAGERGDEADATERLAYFKHIRENIDRVLKLVTEFLTVSKLESLGLEGAKDLVHINAIAEDVVLQQMVIAREKDIRIILQLAKDLKPVIGDSTQLQRVLTNLVGNAVKFTPAGGQISVKSKMVGKDVSLEVVDTGPGIPVDNVPRLFCEFERLKGSANIEGTGLGLFIVKTIVEAHNGSVAVKSQEGVGSKFSILIPACKENCAEEHKEITYARKMKIPAAA
jgi:signal transduction histidine kinase